MIARLLFIVWLCAAQAPAQDAFSILPPDAAPGRTDPVGTLPPAPPASTPRPAASPAQDKPRFGGIEIPLFDPATDSVQWYGQLWQVDNNRVFRARFEKYLNAPVTEIKALAAYDKVISRIMDLLSAAKTSAKNLDEAFRLLPEAAGHEEDANLCDAIANQVLGAWQAKNQVTRLEAANRSLEEERRRHEWNTRMSMQQSSLDNAPREAVAAADWVKQREAERTARMQPHTQRLAEVNALLNANRAKSELSALQARIEFQTLIVQLLAQRRFRHALIATRFYRSVFGDGDNQLRLDKTREKLGNMGPGSKDDKSLFALAGALLGDLPPTITSVELVAREFMRDVKEGTEAVKFMVQTGQMQSASYRLSEAFFWGEHLPEIHSFPRPERQRILDFTRSANQLLSALEVKDYTRAEELVQQMKNDAKDFDPSQPLTAIQTARNVARMHLAQARNAALAGDTASFERELRAAAEIWPNNPELSDASGEIFDQGSDRQKVLNELDTLLERGDHRSIMRQSAQFMAATAPPSKGREEDSAARQRREKLGEVLKKMQSIEASLQRSREILQRGDPVGAWESVQVASLEYPDDTEINRLRADLASGGAATFVRSLNKGGDLERRGEYGAALAWYLDAHRQYPASRLAQERIDDLASRILPGSSGAPKEP